MAIIYCQVRALIIRARLSQVSGGGSAYDSTSGASMPSQHPSFSTYSCVTRKQQEDNNKPTEELLHTSQRLSCPYTARSQTPPDTHPGLQCDFFKHSALPPARLHLLIVFNEFHVLRTSTHMNDPVGVIVIQTITEVLVCLLLSLWRHSSPMCLPETSPFPLRDEDREPTEFCLKQVSCC